MSFSFPAGVAPMHFLPEKQSSLLLDEGNIKALSRAIVWITVSFNSSYDPLSASQPTGN